MSRPGRWIAISACIDRRRTLAALAIAGAVCLPASASVSRLGPGDGVLEILTDTVVVVQVARAAADAPDRPALDRISVDVDGTRQAVAALAVRERPLWESTDRRQAVSGTWLTLTLRNPLPPGRRLSVRLSGGRAWEAPLDPRRPSPAIHVSGTGYLVGFPIQVFVGALTSDTTEIDVAAGTPFAVETMEGRVALRGMLTHRGDRGMPGDPAPYQHVGVADLSALRQAGTYRLRVRGIGVSASFVVGHEPAALAARAYALGLYHQRCGDTNALPYSRIVHGRCHLAAAAVPTAAFTRVNARLSGMTAARPPQQAPPLSSVSRALFPAAARGPMDVSGGHHDAGDYGKYVINGAQLVHALVLAIDLDPRVAALDNLGVPESGDGVGDLLQEAVREADFLARMQDTDGGVWFMVQPRDRPYEDNRMPDQGDPQVVFPKNTAGTAAVVAALAQAGSSRALAARYPDRAQRYLAAASRGWDFLERAWASAGRDGAYQALNGYGDVFGDRDEAAWAATELYLASGHAGAHARLLREFDPSSAAVRRWGWWRMYEGYGAAARSYALAALTGRARGRTLDPRHLQRCRQEIVDHGRDLVRAAADSAYGVSYPDESKRGLRAGWFFPEDAVFDLVVARLLAPSRDLDGAISSNLAFSGGGGPTNVTFVTGLGERWPREIVHQVARNDRRALPPSGIPVGNLRERPAPATPIYDRYSDVFDVTTEATITTIGRGMAASALLMARTPLAAQPWQVPVASISGGEAGVAPGDRVVLTLQAPGLSLAGARVVWEAAGAEPYQGTALMLAPVGPGPWWVEAEAVWPDGRRVSAATEVRAR